jgi:SAM-dependent methyltransferase
MRFTLSSSLVWVLLLGAGSGNVAAQGAGDAPPIKNPRPPDVIFVPTPQEAVDAMLKLANVGVLDEVYDLGCGDGRIAISAAKLGAHPVCIDIDPKRIEDIQANVKQAGLGHRIRVLNQDLFAWDIRPATVVTLYLLPSLNLKLRPKLWTELKPGSRVVSYDFDMGDWKPDKTLTVNGHPVYCWVIPPDAAARAKAELKK